MMKGLPIKLDVAIPFVAAIRAIDGTETSVDAAVDVLLQEEDRHGVAVWAEPVGRSHLGAGVYLPREPVALDELMVLLTDYKRFGAQYQVAQENADDDLIDENLMPFLTATQLVLRGKDFTNDHFILFADGTISAWTQRTWGELLTEWAVTSDWGAHYDDQGRQIQWQPSDFHADIDDDVIEGYGEWQERIRRVIRRKTDRALAAAEAT